MISRFVFAGAAAAVVLGTTAAASAQQYQPTAPSPTYERRSFLEQRVDAPVNALELGVAPVYTQGFGMLQSGLGMPGIAMAGIGVNVDVAYRVVPRLSLGVTGEYYELNAMRGTGARGLAGTLAATYHVDPYTRLDPWVQLGVGYRTLWETFPGTTPTMLYHGLELAKLGVGLDLKASPAVAIGPMIGADLDLFLWQVPSGGTTTAIPSPRLSAFVFAGLQGRFDVGGERMRPVGYAPAYAGP